MKKNYSLKHKSYDEIIRASEINEPAVLSQEIRKMTSSIHNQEGWKWKSVRYVPPTYVGWAETDNVIDFKDLKYGKPTDLKKAWARKFDDVTVLKYKVESRDKTYCEEFEEIKLVFDVNFLKNTVDIENRKGVYVKIWENDDLHTAIQSKSKELDLSRSVSELKDEKSKMLTYKVSYDPHKVKHTYSKSTIAGKS